MEFLLLMRHYLAISSFFPLEGQYFPFGIIELYIYVVGSLFQDQLGTSPCWRVHVHSACRMLCLQRGHPQIVCKKTFSEKKHRLQQQVMITVDNSFRYQTF